MNIDYRKLVRIIISLIVIYLGIATNSGLTIDYKNGTVQLPTKSKKSKVQIVSYQDILRLRLDMKLYEVEAILGQGTIVSQDSTRIVLRWSTDKGYLVCYFDSNKALEKFAQTN